MRLIQSLVLDISGSIYKKVSVRLPNVLDTDDVTAEVKARLPNVLDTDDVTAEVKARLPNLLLH